MRIRYAFLVVSVLAALALMPCTSQAVGQNTVPYTNTFEAYSAGYLITNASGWHSDNSYTIAAISNEADHGLISPYLPTNTPHTKVLDISGTISNIFSSNVLNYVYIDMLVRPEGMDQPRNLPDGCQIVAYVNTNSQLVFFHSYYLAGYQYRWCTNDVDTVQTGQWSRLTFTVAYRESPGYCDAYFTVQVNGAAAFSDPNYGYSEPKDNDFIDGGPWFLTTNSSSYSWSSQFGSFSGLIIDGVVRLDDMVVSDVEPPSGGAPTTTTNGTPVSWLASYYPSTDPDVADWSDTDGDGMYAWQEYQAGTVPTDVNSVFKITTVGNDWSITWLGGTNEENINFRVYRGTSMMDMGSWIIVTNVARNPSGVNLWTDGEKASLTPGAYFYKISAPTTP